MALNRKLTIRNKVGYGVASIGDSVAYMMVGTFLMFFLTTVAGLQPAVAGTITAVASVWDAITNLIMGYISDHARTRWGRRRPFIFFCSFPILITMTLLFSDFDMSYAAKVVFYGFMTIAFWTSFTGFFVPYYALGAEYTQDYDERTSIRSFASFFNMVGTMFAMVVPLAAVEFLGDRGVPEQKAWTITAAALGVITAVTLIITAAVSKDFDRPERYITGESEKQEDREKFSLLKIFREYIDLLKLRPVRLLLLHTIFFLVGYTIIMATFVYFFTYIHGAGGDKISVYLGIRCAIGIAIIPLIERLCKRTDKRTAMLGILIVFGVLMAVFRFIPLSGFGLVLVFIFITATVTCSYWQIIPAIFYDVCEYDEYITGRKREGTILAMQGVTETVSAGLGTQVLGIILQIAGFNGEAEVQSVTALEWIYNCTTWVPVIFLAAAWLALFAFPITKEYYKHIVSELNERKKDE